MKKVTYTLVITLLMQPFVFAQESSYNKFQHQFEIGTNYTKYFGPRSVYDGIGINSARKRGGVSNYFAYKLILNNQHIFKVALLECSSSDAIVVNNNYQLSNTYSKIVELGYGYRVPVKYINTTIFGNLSYRYGGSESVTSNQQNLDWVENKYNSLGVSTQVDLEYFFTKNLGVGLNICYYFFPLESNNITDKGMLVNNNIYHDFEPIKHFMNLNFKLAYKFSITKLKK
ncbi:MAG: hypothetical protein ACEQSR_00780 [Candidatus Methylacidiphilales bacterium]